MKNHYAIKFILLFVLFVTGGLLSYFYGGTDLENVSGSSREFIMHEIRLPKTLCAMLTGIALSLSGLILQIIFRNPLAGPYVLGVSSGASLMVALTVLSANTFGIFIQNQTGKGITVLAAVAGSVLVTLIILTLSVRIRSNVILLLVGLMLSQIFGALQGALEYFSNPGDLKKFVIWGMGSLSMLTLTDLKIYLPLLIIPLLTMVFFIKPLQAMLLGENYAVNAGFNYKRNRFFLILISSVLTGVCTAFCGPIAFVGIAVPLLGRMLFKTSDQKKQILASMLIGSTLLMLSDVLCHSVSSGFTLPVNMITTLAGAPLVIYLLFKNKEW